jgi:hypothetical protein
MRWCLFFFSSCQRRFFFFDVSFCWISLINNISFVVFFLLTLLFCIVSSSDFDLRSRFSKFEFFVVRFFFVKAEIEIRVAETLKFNDCNEVLNKKSTLAVTRIKRLTWTLKMFFFEHSNWYTSKKLMIEITTSKDDETHSTHDETRYTWWEEVYLNDLFILSLFKEDSTFFRWKKTRKRKKQNKTLKNEYARNCMNKIVFRVYISHAQL